MPGETFIHHKANRHLELVRRNDLGRQGTAGRQARGLEGLATRRHDTVPNPVGARGDSQRLFDWGKGTFWRASPDFGLLPGPGLAGGPAIAGSLPPTVDCRTLGPTDGAIAGTLSVTPSALLCRLPLALKKQDVTGPAPPFLRPLPGVSFPPALNGPGQSWKASAGKTGHKRPQDGPRLLAEVPSQPSGKAPAVSLVCSEAKLHFGSDTNGQAEAWLKPASARESYGSALPSRPLPGNHPVRPKIQSPTLTIEEAKKRTFPPT
jgi:hypothetical protein